MRGRDGGRAKAGAPYGAECRGERDDLFSVLLEELICIHRSPHQITRCRIFASATRFWLGCARLFGEAFFPQATCAARRFEPAIHLAPIRAHHTHESRLANIDVELGGQISAHRRPALTSESAPALRSGGLNCLRHRKGQ
jgi:hypothetical protein